MVSGLPQRVRRVASVALLDRQFDTQSAHPHVLQSPDEVGSSFNGFAPPSRQKCHFKARLRDA